MLLGKDGPTALNSTAVSEESSRSMLTPTDLGYSRFLALLVIGRSSKTA